MILKTGSKVKIVNYGSPVLIPKKNYKPGTFPILEESEYSYMVDTAPQLIGKEGKKLFFSKLFMCLISNLILHPILIHQVQNDNINLLQ